MTSIKKQKLDTNEKDSDNFLKPLNLHKERFVKPSADELVKSNDDDHNFVKPLTDERSFVKPLMGDGSFDEHHFDENKHFLKRMSLDGNQDDFNFKKSLIDMMGEDMQDFVKQSNSIENSEEANLFNSKQMDVSLDKSLDRSFNNSSNNNKSPYKPLDVREKSLKFNSFTHQDNQDNLTATKLDRKDSFSKDNSFGKLDRSIDKQFDLNEIKELCFSKPIEKESLLKSNESKHLDETDLTKFS